jgi:hypothetical protein
LGLNDGSSGTGPVDFLFLLLGTSEERTEISTKIRFAY